jgi:bifunctional enzyme CysN/CysC
MICAGDPPLVADQYSAHLLWMDEAELLPGRQYLMKSGTHMARATVSTLKHRVNVNTLENQAATSLHLNEIGYVNLSADRPTVLDPYRPFRNTGAFILIDPFTNRTAGAGVIDFALRRATNIRWQELEIDRHTRAQLNRQRPCVLWFTGLSGAGKSTIANLVEKRLVGMARHTYLLDGDNVRHGLNRDLGFTAEARVENVRRVAEVAKLFVDAGLILLVSLISPFRAERDMARALMDAGDFIEIYVATPIEECERRDPKGLYRRARAGQIPNFTGIDSPYEPPLAPELALDTTSLSAEAAAEEIVGFLQRRLYI